MGNSGSVGVPEVRGKRWKLQENAGGIRGISERQEKWGPVQDTHRSESELFYKSEIQGFKFSQKRNQTYLFLTTS